MQPELLKVQDVADLAQLRGERVYALIRRGEIPSVRIGNAIRVPRSAWETFLREKQGAAGRIASVKT